MEPIAELLGFPEEYGRSATKLDWAAVRAELERAERYWISTTRPDGRPHVVPVDGIWMEDLWYYGGSEKTVHHRAVSANPNVVIHLEDAMRAVIVEGEVRVTKPSASVATRLASVSREKYGYAPSVADYRRGTQTLFPSVVLAWTEFPKDATRFRFES
jgi:pyridoxamine 5'-phosphate oxidase-like protein